MASLRALASGAMLNERHGSIGLDREALGADVKFFLDAGTLAALRFHLLRVGPSVTVGM
jgi:sialic acid synthase SpsE